jgi:hypothetical protein
MGIKSNENTHTHTVMIAKTICQRRERVHVSLYSSEVERTRVLSYGAVESRRGGVVLLAVALVT